MTTAQQSMWLPKRPVEELYHTTNDPDETHNLASDPNFNQILLDLRRKNKETVLSTRDSGLATEAWMYEVSQGSTPYQTLQDEAVFPLESILSWLDSLYFETPENEQILSYLNHEHPLLQYLDHDRVAVSGIS